MSIAPPPTEIRCPQCGWHTVLQPKSDALQWSDIPPDHCPKCGNEELEARRASGATALWARVKKLIFNS